jgi:betaine-aldehyde dehydrogenase
MTPRRASGWATGYFNAGQDCTAAKRALAGERVHPDLAAALTEQATEVRLSKDEQPGAEDFVIPPLNNVQQLGRVTGPLERAPAHAAVLTGGERASHDGYFFAPTVIDGLH